MSTNETKSLRENPRGAQLHVISLLAGEQRAPVALFSLLKEASSTVAVRFAGGCSGMDQATRERLLDYSASGFEAAGGFDGVAMSGGTREDCEPTICQVPVKLRDKFACVAVSSTPRVETMHISDDRGLTITESARLETRQDAAVVVQANASDAASWDSDLEIYLEHMVALRDQGGWTVAVVVFNGGGVTKKEIKGALKRGIPVIVVNGTGRAADQFASEFRAGQFGADFADIAGIENLNELVHIAEFGDPNTLTQGVKRFKLGGSN
jgi:SLOG in TRPM, prokaryote